MDGPNITDIESLGKYLVSLHPPVYLSVDGFTSQEKYKSLDPGARIESCAESIDKIRGFISDTYTKSNRFNRQTSSEALMHECNKYLATNQLEPTTNGIFIAVMIISGFEWRRPSEIECDPSNCLFKFRRARKNKCSRCNIIGPVTMFYTKNNRVYSTCKKCYENYGKLRKCSIDLVSPEIMAEIKKYIDEGFALKHIAKKYQIPYSNMFHWKTKGWLQ